jgi:hypothetical protein
MNRPVFALVSIAALALLSACGGEPEPEAAANAAAAAAKPAPAPAKAAPAEDPTGKMARAVGAAKPGAAVEIKYEFLAKPTVGTPTEVEIAFIPNIGVDALDAIFSGMEGVTLAGPLTATFANVESGKPYTHRFSLLPDRAGVFYISVAVNTQIGGSTLGRTFSIPFVVGNPPAQKKAQPATDASGEAIEPMKAEETRG